MHLLITVCQSDTNRPSELLTEDGQRRLQKLGELLRIRLTDLKALLIVSCAPAATKSGDILARAISPKTRINTTALWYATRAEAETNRAVGLIRDASVTLDAVIVVGQGESIDHIFERYLERFFDMVPEDLRPLAPAQARLIDCHSKTVVTLP